MKRFMAMLIAALLLFALAAQGFAEQEVVTKLYVNRDSLRVYKSPSTDSKPLTKLMGGTEVILAGQFGDWYAIYYTDFYGQTQAGYVEARYMSLTLPDGYCNHNWSEWTLLTAPTCTENGVYTRACSICGLTETQPVDRLGHSFTDWAVLTEPTCSAQGLRFRVCNVCGYREEQAIEPIAHQYGAWVQVSEGSCTQPGERRRQCAVCGYVEVGQTELAAHTYGSWTLLSEPTCTATGERVRWCVVCGTRDAQTLNLLPHEFGSWTVTVAATCTAPGERARRCVICGTRETEVIDQLAHEYGAWSVARTSTCTQKGQEARACVMCGTQQQRDIPMLPHQYQWVTTLEATDHSAGTRAYRCQVCGTVDRQQSFDPEGTLRKGARGDEVRALQQLLADQGYLAAGGVDGSYGGGTERALMQFQRDQGLTADGVAWPQTRQRLNHDYGDWRVEVALTRERDGVYTRTCRDCGYQDRVTIPAGQSIERSKRGEDVRAVQRMLNDLGYSAGTADGAYGPKLDAAFEAFAAENNLWFTPGRLTPSDVDALMNAWVVEVPSARWMGQGSRDSAVRLILTVTQQTSGDTADLPGLMRYDWKLTNMGAESCRIDGVLLSFGENSAFTSDSLVMALDGSLLARNGGNSASGSFSVSADWGEGNLNFCAFATSEKTGAVWQSNTKAFQR